MISEAHDFDEKEDAINLKLLLSSETMIEYSFSLRGCNLYFNFRGSHYIFPP